MKEFRIKLVNRKIVSVLEIKEETVIYKKPNSLMENEEIITLFGLDNLIKKRSQFVEENKRLISEKKPDLQINYLELEVFINEILKENDI